MSHANSGKGGCKRRVIVVTDGDHMALRALKMAARRTGCQVIAESAGNPTPATGIQLVDWIRQSAGDPVIVMLDDNGNKHESGGESALSVLLHHPDIEVIGALAVASKTTDVEGAAVDFSIDRFGNRVERAVDKDGFELNSYIVEGDTVDILRRLDAPVVIGIGDIGKMQGRDAPQRGSPVTTSAIEWVLMLAHNHRQERPQE
ncbi:stage V sporulation protein AE [Alicyclobacillus hesperidum subsp. aegles]|uniref:stage V sporulation protein AE n=1 Tax=Alicyclobacillus hesperidum TaxID=89784 RepID=UPI0009F89871|nr:stage V sporulation protein AE [Alicyclobacillus hesperidum]GLG01011.1 stage V sporulation protein AE [Alicyclobacillus hesperidum subsp. aegles]